MAIPGCGLLIGIDIWEPSDLEVALPYKTE